MATYSDSFTGGANTSLPAYSPNNWTTVSGTTNCVLNNIGSAATGTIGGTNWNVFGVARPVGGDQFCEAQYVGARPGTMSFGVLVRGQSATRVGYAAEILPNGQSTNLDQIRLVKWTGSSGTVLAIYNIGGQIATNDIVRIEIYGTSPANITVKRNGTTIITWTDSTPQTGGVPGLYFLSTTSPVGQLDNLNAGDWVVTTVPKTTSVQANIGTANDGAIWIPVTSFLNGWNHYGLPNQGASYWRDDRGLVHLRGSISGGTLGSAAFILPSGFTPAKVVEFVGVANGAFAVCQVLADGSVIPVAGSNTLFDLNTFYFDATEIGLVTVSKTITALALIQGTALKTATVLALTQGTVSKTATALAVIQSTISKTINALALIQGTVSKTATVTGFILGTVPRTATVSAQLATRALKTSSATALVGSTKQTTTSVIAIVGGSVTWGQTFSDVPGSTVTLNASGIRKVRVDASMSCYTQTAGGTVNVRLLQDGTPIGSVYQVLFSTLVQHQGWSFRWLLSAPTQGSHVYKLQAAISPAGSILKADANDYITMLASEC